MTAWEATRVLDPDSHTFPTSGGVGGLGSVGMAQW